MKRGEGAKLRNWQGLEKKLASTARGMRDKMKQVSLKESLEQSTLVLYLGPGENSVRSDDFCRGHKAIPLCISRTSSDSQIFFLSSFLLFLGMYFFLGDEV